MAAKEKWVLGGAVLEVVNNYKCLGLTFSTGHSFTAAMEDTSIRAKKSTLEVLRALKKINCNSPEVFFKLFDAQTVPTLLYAAEIWGYRNMNKLSVCTFLLVRMFCMCVIRLQMMWFTEN